MNLVEQSVQIPASGVALDADLTVPEPQRGVVLFAHGSGSSRHSPRNRYVAGEGRYVLIHTGGNRWLLHRMDPAAPGRPAPRPGCCPPGSPVRTW